MDPNRSEPASEGEHEREHESERARDGAGAEALRHAATVVLLRDAEGGPEVLLLERPSDRGSFAGAWVFPGGAVDPEDRVEAAASAASAGEAQAESDERAARAAAVREVKEECGLVVLRENLVAYSRWTPPLGIPKRMRTWFFLAEAPAGSIRLAPGEVVGHRWIRPTDALTEHSAGGLALFPPTWVTLNSLAGHATVVGALDAAVEAARRRGSHEYVTRIATSARGKVVLWSGDIAHTDVALIDAPGPRNRLEIGDLPWVYREEPTRD